MKTRMIYNAHSGMADHIKDFLALLDTDRRCELCAARHPEDVRRIAREAADDGIDRLIVAGGDGTIHQAVNGLAPEFGTIELAILPFGTGNDLARSLGLLAEDMALLSQRIFEAPSHAIDVGRISSGGSQLHFINVANGGIGGRVAIDIAQEDKRRWGAMAYWLSSVTRLIDMQVFDIELQIDDSHIVIESAYGVAVANGRFVGGGFAIAPTARLDDGLLDITVIPAMPTVELMAAGLNFTLGRNTPADPIRSYYGRRIDIRAIPDMPFSIDGEAVQRLESTFEVLPQALRVVAGLSPPGLKGGQT